MKKMMLWAIVPLLFAATSAAAQTNGGSSVVPKNSTSSSPATGQAPIGHRQPRGADFADVKSSDNPNDGVSKDDLALARKIKNICRGC